MRPRMRVGVCRLPSYVRVIAVRPGQAAIERRNEVVDRPRNQGVVIHGHIAGDDTYAKTDTCNMETNPNCSVVCFLVFLIIYSKQSILWLTQECFRLLSIGPSLG